MRCFPPNPHEHHYLGTPFSQNLRGWGRAGVELLGGSFSVPGGAGGAGGGQGPATACSPPAAPPAKPRQGHRMLSPAGGAGPASFPTGARPPLPQRHGLRGKTGLRREAPRPLVPGPGRGQPILAPLQPGPASWPPSSVVWVTIHSPPLTHRQPSTLRRDPWVEECPPRRLTIPHNRYLPPHGPLSPLPRSLGGLCWTCFDQEDEVHVTERIQACSIPHLQLGSQGPQEEIRLAC